MALLYFSFQPFPTLPVGRQGQQTLGQRLCHRDGHTALFIAPGRAVCPLVAIAGCCRHRGDPTTHCHGCRQVQQHHDMLSHRDLVHWHQSCAPTEGTPQWPHAPKTEHNIWGLPWHDGERPVHGRDLAHFPAQTVPVLTPRSQHKPARRPSVLPVQCCHVLLPLTKPPPAAH